MSNIYYDPQNYGLKKLMEIAEPNLSYEYNILCVWEDIETGHLYWGENAGCSCPSPFDAYTSRSDLNQIRLEQLSQFETEVNNFPADYADRLRLIEAVRHHLDDFGLWVKMVREESGLKRRRNTLKKKKKESGKF